MTTQYGLAGKLAAAFIHSKLTPLVIIASLLLGVYAALKKTLPTLPEDLDQVLEGLLKDGLLQQKKRRFIIP